MCDVRALAADVVLAWVMSAYNAAGGTLVLQDQRTEEARFAGAHSFGVVSVCHIVGE